MKRLLLVVLLIGPVAARAQMPAEPEVRRAVPVSAPDAEATPEVRRAEPVNPETYPNPEWMSRVPANPVTKPEPLRAEPLQTPIPVATPIPIPIPIATPLPPDPTPVPVATPEATPMPEATPPLQAERPDSDADSGDAGGIRFAPDPGYVSGNRSLMAGNGFYRRKMYDMAVVEYEKYLISEPQGEGRDGAMFRLAESHRFLGNERAAKEGYQRLLSEFTEGDFVGAGAYRLGEILYNAGSFGPALAMFEKAEDRAASDEVRLSAQYYAANCLAKAGKDAPALEAFEKIAAVEGGNPYREEARFFVAGAQMKAGDRAAAYAAYNALAGDASRDALRAEAGIKAAALAVELKKPDEARRLFEAVMTNPDAGEWQGVARLGLVRLDYEAGDFKKVLALSDGELAGLPKDSVPEVLLMKGNALKETGDTVGAVAVYAGLIEKYPDSAAATQARFKKLVLANASGGDEMLKEVDAFLAVSSSPTERSQAFLLKAETLFAAGRYQEAADLYAKVIHSRLSQRFLEQALFKLGWCYAQLGDTDTAAQTFTDFLTQYPGSDLKAKALAQRALAYQQSKAYDAALKDFDVLIAEPKDLKERELALQQRALILGQQEDYDAMAEGFAKLLEDYPGTQGAAQAYFWMGWAAFEKKEYARAVESLRKARELDPKQFGDRATLRILLAHYYDKDREAVAAEAGKIDPAKVPAEVMVWLGGQYFDEGDYARAIQFLKPLADRAPVVPVSPDVFISLARAEIAQGDYAEAKGPVSRYLATAKDPSTRARGLMASAQIAMGEGEMEQADKLIDEALLLQPEGRLNAEARVLSGEALMKQGQYDEAARAFVTVAVLYDDSEITPTALKRAAEAYRKAGNSLEAEKALKELKERFPEPAAEKKPATAALGG